ncbi:AAC-rich mRNA clone AAC11 protein isoform X2 [Ochlerotatus camptorhynchus]
MNTSEFPTSISRNSPKHDFPLHNNYTSSNSNGSVDFNHYPSPGSPGGHLPGGGGPPPPPPGSAQQQDLTIDGIQNNFPHRRSRASRTFKNPPQPHMCIKEKTIDGKEVFINVLSWTRIANPDNPDAPIPLYGGMKVGKIPPGSPRMPPLVYAVMASPEVLKKAGRKCPDTPERMNLVDLMCEFVEAMNPTLHLSRKPEILKDRDLSGELKDVWSAVQACRDKGRVDSGPPENLVVYTEFGPETAPSYEQSQQQQRHQPQQQQHLHYQQQEDFQLRLGPNQYDHHSYEQQTQHLHQHGRQSSGDPYSTRPAHQPLTHDYYNNPSSKPQPQKHQQSAITNNSIEPNSEKQHPIDVPDSASSSNSEQLNSNSNSSNNNSVDDLIKETDSLKLSPAASGGVSTKSNGLTLPTGGGGGAPPSPATENTAATSPSSSSSSANNDSNPVPVASKQQTSPTSPTQQQQTATVSPTAATPPTPQKESKNSSSHNFFPMFRSSKSSSSSSNSDKSSSHHHHHHNDKDKDKDGTGESTAPDTPVKTSSKKSGLNFFRRNKSSDSKKEQPSTPTKQVAPVASQQQTTAENNKLNLLVDESLMHHHHHMEGNNGTGEIIENSTATIAAK